MIKKLKKRNLKSALLLTTLLLNLWGCDELITKPLPPLAPPPDVSPEARAIWEVLVLDDMLAHRYLPKHDDDSSLHSKANKSVNLARMVLHMDDIVLKDCPEDFAIAYKTHIVAWRKELSFLVDHKIQPGDILISRALSEEEENSGIHLAYDEITQEISATFNDVMKIASSFGIPETEYKGLAAHRDELRLQEQEMSTFRKIVRNLDENQTIAAQPTTPPTHRTRGQASGEAKTKL